MSVVRPLSLLVLVAVALVAAVQLSCVRQQEPQQPAAITTAADSIAHGRYLALTMGCMDCHTPGAFYGAPDTTRQLAGSELGWRGPWGVSYASNLTPHAETGLGTWTAEQIVNTIRTGQRPDGSTLLPPMPWPNYGVLSDRDAHALVAYLRSLPPVEHRVPEPLPPGRPARGPTIDLPPPPPWDSPRSAPPGAAPADTGR